MKKYSLYVVIVLLCSCLGVRAEKKTGSCGTNLTWTLDTETMALTISGTGTMKEFENLSPWDEYCESNSTFPKSLTIEDGVTGISRYAFQYCQEVSNLYIPKSLTNISQGAFARSNFQSIIVAEDNPVYDSRENCNAIIHTATNTLHIGSTSTVIPSSVTAIGSQSFMACGNLVSLDIPQTVTSMGDNVFPDCWNLSSIVIPEGVTKIGSMMFYNCTALKSATIPEGVTSIAESAFAFCSSLTSITIPKSVTNLGNSIFEGCIKLSEIWMLPTTPPSFSKSTVFVPSNTKIIVPAASYDAYCNAPYWSGMKSQIVANPSERVITIEAQDAQSALQEALGESDLLSITGLTISGTINSYDFEFLRTKMTKLAHLDLSQASVVYNEHRHYETFNTYDNQFPAYAFYNCSNLVSISLPKGVDRISHSAFMGCSNLTSIIIPDNLQYIEGFAFYKCSNLSSIDIPNDVSVIYESAFEGCGKLTEIVLPGNITFIDKNLFKGCSGLTSILIPSAVTSISSGAFSGCIELKEITLNNSLTTVEWDVFQNCTSLTSIAIPSSVTSLNWSAFAGCSNLTRIDISDLSKWIAIKFDGLAASYYSLYLNDNLLTDLVIPSGITTIGDNTFACCNSITSVSLPEGITSIGEFAFGAMLGLKAVTIPSTVTNIGKEAFYCCDNLKVINFLSATPPAIFGFQIAPYTTEFVVPASSYDAYCSAPNWSSLKERIMKNDTPKRTVYLQAASSKSALQEMIGEENLQYITHLTITGTVNSYDFEVIRKKMPSLTHLDMGKANMTGSTSTDYAFYGCTSLASISLPEGVTSIGSYAFSYCTSLTSISLPESITSIEQYAFQNCDNLTNIHLASISSWCNIDFYEGNINPQYAHPLSCNYLKKNLFLGDELIIDLVIPEGVATIPDYAFYRCDGIRSVTLPESVTSIGSFAFRDCSSLTSISLPESITSIGTSAFQNCSNLTSISLPESITSIGTSAFSNCSALGELHLLGTTPPALTSVNFVPTNPTIFIVPANAYDAYCAAPYWADIKDRITTDALCTQSVELTAAKDKSDLQVQIGDDKLRFVTDLTISGTINSYDFMILRNKMPLLRHLDLSQANIVANSYEHYTGYHTENNIFPAYGLYSCNLTTLSFLASIKSIENFGLTGNDYLREISIHKGVTSIGSYAFQNCSNLTSISLPEGVTSIGSYAFRNCSNLTSISLPEGVTSIGSYAFYNCTSLPSISLSESITSIGSEAFRDCRSLISVKLSPNLKTIGSYAFFSCSKLTEIHIPASVRSIGDNAFSYCNNLKDVYVYIVEPTDIGQNTFTKNGNNFIGTLHAPKVSYWDYYYNTQWSQFLEFAEFDGKYDNFYLEGDKVLDNNTGSIEGEEGNNPDAEMGNNSGIIVEDDVNQDLGDVDIEHDGENGGSIIVDGTGDVDFENLNFRISVKGGRWYFFCFPFDVRAEDIRCESGAEWVFRYYDGEERAQNGKGGWKNVTSDSEGNMLKAARGYIFQCSKNDVLVLTAKNGKIKQENKYNELVEHVTENMHDASWNFVGNPYLSYYEVTSEDYSAPITVWDGSKYIAIRPGDDDYQLAPFEAFFVQKPEGVDQVSYNSENQMTYTQATEAAAQARQARAQQAITPNRLLVNITLTDGKETDRARVVFNENAEAEYETACDAAKFGTEGVPQIYTMDATDVKYAINERPMAQGNVSMGYSVPKQGTYTLAATRMDIAVYLMDKLTGTVHDLTKGGYEFSSESGTFDKRFILIVKGDATGIDGVMDVDADAPIYNVKGQQVKDMNQSDIYIQDSRKMVKK